MFSTLTTHGCIWKSGIWNLESPNSPKTKVVGGCRHTFGESLCHICCLHFWNDLRLVTFWVIIILLLLRLLNIIIICAYVSFSFLVIPFYYCLCAFSQTAFIIAIDIARNICDAHAHAHTHTLTYDVSHKDYRQAERSWILRSGCNTHTSDYIERVVLLHRHKNVNTCGIV